MGRTVKLLSFVFYLLITIGIFYFVPNGILLTIATLPYILWWLFFKTKAHYLLIPLVFFVMIFIFVGLPIMELTGVNEDLVFFGNMYDLIYPNSWSYSWSIHIPEIIMLNISITISFILFTKLMLWIIKRLRQGISKFNFVLALSQFIMWVMFFYTILNLIPALVGQGVLDSFRSLFAVSVFYDIMFVWIPFIVIYFLIEYIADKFIWGEN